jgi:polysaccharide biosynthesis protein PslH
MPAEEGNGLAMRAGVLAEGLARAGSLRVVVAPAFGDPGPPSALARRVAARVDVLDDPGSDLAADFMSRLAMPSRRDRATALHPKPKLCRVASLQAADRVAAMAEDAALVVAMRTYLAPLLDLLLEAPHRPALALDVDDVESVTQGQLDDVEEAAKFARLEAHYLPLVDRVLTCSAEDARQLSGLHGLGQVDVVPNAVRLPQRRAASVGGADHDLIFVGNLSYEPNVDAARWLCTEVMPRLGAARLALVGSRPAADVRALAGDRVTLAADVDDVAPWYESSRLAVAPLRAGGGTSIKVIEAFAHRRPVVATTVAMRGLERLAGPEGPALIADTPEDFAGACGRLLADPALAAELADAGAAEVAASASVDVVAGRVEALARAMFAS